MISQEICIKTLLERFPTFVGQWQSYIDSWEGEQVSLCLQLSLFADYISDLIKGGQMDLLSQIFAFVEELMVQGEAKVREAAATCLLENLLNYFSAGEISADAFVPLLGSESRTYCRAWDEFTGVQTPGLW